MGADRAARVEQLVVAACVGNVGRQAPLRHGPGLGGSGHLGACPGPGWDGRGRRSMSQTVSYVRLRSRVNGKSLLVASDGALSLPGVWPILKNRASRRLSDSKALTGNVT